MQWKELILKQAQSNLSIVLWCRQNKIAVQTFYYWRNKLFPKPLLTRNAFTEIVQENDNVSSGVSLLCKGVCVLLNRNFDSSVLKACLKVLQQC
ncbi:IS66 family insertion sequence element accessory protein TnpA [Parachlamydia acanthamoebae]|nr:hypothetical protein DB43_EE00010 [Parachlamydia acanthamoebae]